MTDQVVFVSAARTAIGSFGRSLKDVPATRLATVALEAAVARAGIESGRVGHVVFGNVVHGEPRDAYLSRVAALEGHRRAARAIVEGRFKTQIVPVAIRGRKESVVFDRDEHVRPDVTMEGLSGLRTAFAKEGSVTAGNASGLNDGAAALVLMNEAAARSEGREILGRIASYAHSGIDPAVMGLGPVGATRKALVRAGIGIADLKVIESNEAFAALCRVSLVSRRRSAIRMVEPSRSDIRSARPVLSSPLRRSTNCSVSAGLRPRHYVHRRWAGHRAGREGGMSPPGQLRSGRPERG